MQTENVVDEITVQVADTSHLKYVDTILTTIEAAAKVRGTGIARRNPAYVAKKNRGRQSHHRLARGRICRLLLH